MPRNLVANPDDNSSGCSSDDSSTSSNQNINQQALEIVNDLFQGLMGLLNIQPGSDEKDGDESNSSEKDDDSSDGTEGENDKSVSKVGAGKEKKSKTEKKNKKKVEPKTKEENANNLVECKICGFKFCGFFTTELASVSICFFCESGVEVKASNEDRFDEMFKGFKDSINDEVEREFPTKDEFRKPNIMLLMQTGQSVEDKQTIDIFGIALKHIYSNIAIITVITKLKEGSQDVQAKQVTKIVNKVTEAMRKRDLILAGYNCVMSPIFKEFLKETKLGDDLVLPDVFDLVITIIANIWMGKSVNFGDVKFQFDPDVLDQVFPDDNPFKKTHMTFEDRILDMQKFLQPKNIQKLHKHHKIVDSLTPEEKFQQTEVFQMLHDLLNYGLNDGYFEEANKDFFEKLDKTFEFFEVENDGADHHLQDLILQNSVRNLSKNFLAFYKKFGKFQIRSATVLSLDSRLKKFKGKDFMESVLSLSK